MNISEIRYIFNCSNTPLVINYVAEHGYKDILRILKNRLIVLISVLHCTCFEYN